MEMLLPDWEKKEMNVEKAKEKAKEKAQINNESGNTTIPEYLFIRDLPGRAVGR